MGARYDLSGYSDEQLAILRASLVALSERHPDVLTHHAQTVPHQLAWIDREIQRREDEYRSHRYTD
jgi:hypothetical protein